MHMHMKASRANGIGGDEPPTAVINITRQIGEIKSLESARKIFDFEGRMLADILIATLPGGTIDALIGEMMRRRASLFSVPFVEIGKD